MKKIVVNDTNVFIDLHDVGLLKQFFDLPWEIHTTDLVMLELLREGQKDTVTTYESDGALHIVTFTPKEFNNILGLHRRFSLKQKYQSQTALFGTTPNKIITPY